MTTRYQRGNQIPSIKGQTTQWTTEKDTKGIIRIVNQRTDHTMDNRKRYQRYNQNPSIKGQTTQWTTDKDTKGIIRFRQSKDRQHNGQQTKIPKV